MLCIWSFLYAFLSSSTFYHGETSLFIINTLTGSGKLFPTPVRALLRLAKYPPSQGLNKLEECTTKPPRLACPNELPKPKSSDLSILEIGAVSAAVSWVPTEARQGGLTDHWASGASDVFDCHIHQQAIPAAIAKWGNSMQFTNCSAQHPSVQTNPVYTSRSLAFTAGAGTCQCCPVSCLFFPPSPESPEQVREASCKQVQIRIMVPDPNKECRKECIWGKGFATVALEYQKEVWC